MWQLRDFLFFRINVPKPVRTILIIVFVALFWVISIVVSFRIGHRMGDIGSTVLLMKTQNKFLLSEIEDFLDLLKDNKKSVNIYREYTLTDSIEMKLDNMVEKLLTFRVNKNVKFVERSIAALNKYEKHRKIVKTESYKRGINRMIVDYKSFYKK